jgi:hypothetical protein
MHAVASLPRKAVALLGILVAAAGCGSKSKAGLSGASDGGQDATAGEDAGDDADAGLFGDAETPVLPPCAAYGAEGGSAPSEDCVWVGHCPLDCLSGTASAYACASPNPATAAYPSVLHPPSDPFVIVAYQPNAYPWDAGAFVACAVATCVRWSLGDSVQGSSQWPGDPCSSGSDSGAATQAWVCPAYEGFAPQGSGCLNAGNGAQIGGGATGVALNVVWCCPTSTDGGVEDGSLSDGSLGDGAVSESGMSEGGVSDASTQ